MDPLKKILLYASGGNTCDEEDYITLLKEFIETKKLENVQILIRPHIKHKGDLERFLMFDGTDGIVIDKTGRQDSSLRDNWDISENYTANLFNSLSHADICINVGSTITIDAAVCGTPSINLNFDVREGINPHRSTKRLFTSDYVQALINTGGTWLAENKDEFLRIIQNLLARSRRNDSVKRDMENLISYMIYRNDGNASDRIVNVLEEISQRYHTGT